MLAALLPVLFVGALLGCGESPPDNVATIGDVVVSKEQFDAWAPVFATAGQAHEADRAAVVGFLIRSVWLEEEARKRAVNVGDSAIARAVASRKRMFPTQKDFRRYLDGSGMNADQFRARVRRDVLAHRLMRIVASPDLSVSNEDVARFYRRHRAEFKRPRTRDLHVVVTRSRGPALAARKELASRPWTEVSRKFTVDATRRSGGRTSIDTTNVIPELRRSVFSAPIGSLRGPLEIRGSWWVFRVDRELPARQLTLLEVTPRIRISIRSTREQLGLDRLTAYLTRRYRPHTICHDGYQAPECRNASGRLNDPGTSAKGR